LSVLALYAVAFPVYAQSTHVLGTTVNLTSGGSNRRGFPTSPAGSSEFRSFVGFYPSLSLTSSRTNSALSANYAYGINRKIGSSFPQPPGSHNASLNFSTTLSPRWNATVSDTFSVTDALGTVDALSGAAPQATNPLVPFSSVAVQTSIYTNGLNAGLSWALDQSSSIAFTARHSIQKYGSGAAVGGLFANQQQVSGGFSFQQQLGTMESWSLSFRSTHSEYGNSQDSIAQSASAGYSMQIGPDTTLQIGAGLSQVNSGGRGELGYDASTSVQKTIQSNNFFLSFNQSNTEIVGLGSTSLTRRGDFGWNRAFGKTTASAAVSIYDSGATLNNTVDTRGATATVNGAVPITDRLSLSGGVRFERTTGSGTPSFTQRRIVVSGRLAYAISPTLSFSGGVAAQNIRETAVPNFTQKSVVFSLQYTEPNLKRF
jgi:hypothetical protein